MSRAALALAVRDHLRDTVVKGGLALTAQQCELAPDGGRPPEAAGPLFVGVYTGGRVVVPSTGLDEIYRLIVVVTVRTGHVPYDRLGPAALAKAAVGFDAWVDKVRWCVHRDQWNGNKILQRANVIIGFEDSDGDTPRGFNQPLAFLSDDDPQPVGPLWFGAEDTAEGGPCGVVQRLTFGNARRTQSFLEGVAS